MLRTGGLLPYRLNSIYTNNRSLARHRDEVAAKLDNVYRKVDQEDYSCHMAQIWNDLTVLFDLVDNGHSRYGVAAYNGGLFNLEANIFLSDKVLSDWYVARILDQLGRARQPDRPELGLFRVDYRDLAIQQLGNVYEGLLELQPRFASKAVKLIVRKKGGRRTERYIPSSNVTPKGFQETGVWYKEGAVYLATDKGERRRSGSYYTPDHIVCHIVESTLGGVCAELSECLRQEVSAVREGLSVAAEDERGQWQDRLRELETDFDERVLRIRVLDPAMGSGHFLIRACQHLAEEIATHPYSRDPRADELEEEESILSFWKRKVAERCLYGVDRNPMAVELAKLALWLDTVAAEAPLTFLDHHFRCGDSIVGARVEDLDSLPGETGVLKGRFREHVADALPTLLYPLEAIRSLPSETMEQVKRKEGLFRRRFIPAQSRFSTVGDIRCATVMGLGNSRGSADHTRACWKLSSQPRNLTNYVKATGEGASRCALRCRHTMFPLGVGVSGSIPRSNW